MRKFSIWPIILIPILAFPALWPFYTIGLPDTADGSLHLLRLVALDAHIEQGIFFPRWVPELFLGYGYPLFNFYGPSTYYLAELFHLLGLGHSYALIGVFIFFIVLAGYGAYWLAVDIFTRSDADCPRKNLSPQTGAALVVAVAYMYTPYFLTNVYLRGAMGEVGAQALLPWIFWSFRRLLTDEDPRRYVLPATLSLGGLAITHNITLLFAPLIILIYILIIGHGQWKKLAWAALAGLLAMGLSAFFWIPLLLERAYLSDVAYDIAETYLPENVWTWQNFLDLHWPFEYTLSIPFQLGFLQIILLMVGLLVGWHVFLGNPSVPLTDSQQHTPTRGRAYSAEWWFWLGVALIACLGISQWAEPIWLNNSLLLIAQFPWRLLSIASLPLALWAGRTILWATGARSGVILSVLLIATIILTHRPQVSALEPFLHENIDLHLANIAQFEKDTNAFGTSSASEFKPRWARSPFAPQEVSSEDNGRSALSITLQKAGPLYIQAYVSAQQKSAFHFTEFYYPGWQVTFNDRILESYPDPLIGLLTVDLPAEEGVLTVQWRGTLVQRSATAITLLTLLLLVLFLWQTRQRRVVILPLVLLICGVMATIQPTATYAEIEQPPGTQPLPHLDLLGLRTQLEDTDTPSITIYPYWWVEAPLPEHQITWSLLDRDGNVLSQTTASPYFNTIRTSSWPPNTMVDDAYVLSLPSDLAADIYRLSLAISGLPVEPMIVSEIALPATPQEQVAPDKYLARYQVEQGENAALLERYEVAVNHQIVAESDKPLVIEPEASVIYTLYWRSDGVLPKNYHSFIHFVDRHQNVLMQRDQLPGPMFQPPLLWNSFYARPDHHHVTVPADAASGLYYPQVGLYGFDDQRRLDAYDQAGTQLGSSMALPPIKVVNSPTEEPEIALEARWGEIIALQGYTIETPHGNDSVRAGTPLTLTLHYASLAQNTVDYTQFVHLYDPVLGMVAQSDTQPAQGKNPTSAWVAGEIIMEKIPLQIVDGVKSGRYRLQIGFYDAQSGGVRLPVYDGNENPLLDAQVILTELEIIP